MKKSSVMVVLGFALALTACQGGGKAPESGASQANEAAKEDLAAQGGEAKGEEAKGEEPGDDGAKAAASGETVTLKLSNNQPDGNCTTVAVEWFADQVRERTDGRVNIEVYNNGTLGDAISCLEQAQFGGMDIVKADLSTMTNFVDDYNALMMPYIYKDTEHFWKVHGGDVGMGILRGDKMKEKKLYGLTYYDGGTRCFYNTKKEIHSPEDMKGMLVRVQEWKGWADSPWPRLTRKCILRCKPGWWMLRRIPLSIIWISPILRLLPILWKTITPVRRISW